MNTTNYWIWDDRVTSEDQAYIERCPPAYKKYDIEMDSGSLIKASITDPIDIHIKNTSPYFLTDNLVGPVARSLVISSKLQRCLAACGVENIQYFPCRIFDAEGNLASDDYKVANIIGKVKCIDMDASEVIVDSFSSKIAVIESLALLCHCWCSSPTMRNLKYLLK